MTIWKFDMEGIILLSRLPHVRTEMGLAVPDRLPPASPILSISRWSSEAPVCARTDCESLNKPENGNIEFEEKNGQDIAIFSCDKGMC